MDEYGNLFNEFEKYYAEIEPYQLSRDYFIEVALRNVELLTIGYRLYQLEQVYNARGEQSFTDRKNNTIQSLEGVYKDYSKQVDEKVFEQLIALYSQKSPKQFLPEMLKDINPQELTQKVYSNSKLTSYDGVKELLTTSNDPQEIIKTLNTDPGYELIKAMMNAYIEKVSPKYEELTLELDALQRTYMKGILELSPKEARIFPDANSTMRVTYGQVKGYEPRDAVYYEPVTYLDGVIEKYVPGDYEFDVPQRLIELYNKKDYGPYGENGKMPVGFLGTNHTTGGTSGSPAIDAKGNLIGLNFDRVWEGTMSDVYYDPSICRNIMVDIRYVLFIIDKYAGDKRLIEEMKLVNVKKK